MAFKFKSTGTNTSERYLARLSEKSFLRLWSYPNMYASPGKELIDLLIVCGNYVFIISDKDCGFKSTNNLSIDWKRWWKKSIHKSIFQILSAEKHIFYYRKSVFSDAKCNDLFPIDIPSINDAKVFRILVAKGCEDIYQNIHNEIFDGFLTTSLHQDIENTDKLPAFCIGDINSSGGFIHVLDEFSLDLVFEEFDTLIDFATYLEKRESLFRSGLNVISTSEAGLISRYIHNSDEDGNHAFLSVEDIEDIEKNNRTIISFDGNGAFLYKTLPHYIERKKLDSVSYLWDKLITKFVDHILNGTITIIGNKNIEYLERGLRVMAHETRFSRRILSTSIIECQQFDNKLDVHFRGIINANDANATPYIILHTKQTNDLNDEEYKNIRHVWLESYCICFLDKFYPTYKTVVGIGFNYFGQPTQGNSEDLCVISIDELDEKMKEHARTMRDELNIFDDKKLTQKINEFSEYPK